MAADAIKDDRFYIITHEEMKDQVSTRLSDIIAGRNPTLQSPSPDRSADPLSRACDGA